MSVDTKIFVKCSKDKALDVMDDLMNKLQEFVRERKNEAGVSVFQIFKMNNCPDYSGPRYTVDVEARCSRVDIFSLDFGCGDEYYRSVKFFPCIKGDYNHVCRGNKIIVSLGTWGSYLEISKIVCDVLAKYGDTYYDLNDCDDIDFQKYNGDLIPLEV